MAEAKKTSARKSAAKKSAAKKSSAKKATPSKPAAKKSETPQVDRRRSEPAVNQGSQTEDGTQGRPLTEQELEAVRQGDLHTERARHAQRTGGGVVREGELEAAREEHNRRTDGVEA